MSEATIKTLNQTLDGQGKNALINWELDQISGDPTPTQKYQIKLDAIANRLKFHDGQTVHELATLADLVGLNGGSAVNTEGLILKVLLATETTFYVRNGSNPGNSGKSELSAFASIEEALIVLSNTYEISGHLILDLDTNHTLRCTEFPNFTGSGKITIRGSNTTITFVAFNGSTEAYLANWSALSFSLENITFAKGDCTKFLIEGGKITFNNINFDNNNVQFDNCRFTSLKSVINNARIRFYRSNLKLESCKISAEFYYCQTETINCSFNGIFIVEACNLILRNPRLNNRWWTVTSKIVNTTIEFKSSWLTFENLGSDPQTKPLLSFQNCNLKDFPSNVDVQGNRTFYETAILKYINCQTPEEFNNVSYNFSAHTFSTGASAIELVNTAFLKNINITGAGIKRDAFSILGGKNYDNSVTGIPAETLQEAIDYIINNLVNS